MKNRLIFIGLGVTLVLACQRSTNNPSNIYSIAEQQYKDAGKMVEESNYDSAIVLLRRALENGIETPMQIVTDSNFTDLINSPPHRPEIRSVLEEFAVESHAVMSDEDPGQLIFVQGLIVDEATNTPLNDVRLELVHTDREGFYFREKSMWNPRIFAYLKTDDNGEFSIHTIRPGKYRDDEGNYVPAHIHFTLKKVGYRIYGSEFTFEDDSIFKANGNIDQVPVARLQGVTTPGRYQVTIPLQRE